MAAANYFDSVQKLYIAFYQRPADSGGLLYWSQRLDAAKGSLEGVVDAFATSAEANTLYGAVDKDTVGAVVDKIYQALFNRTPDEAGKKYYVDGFLAGKFTAGKIALDVLNGATNNDLVAINNKVTVANRFTETVDGRAMTDDDFGVGSVFAATYAGDTDAQAAREILVGVTSNPVTMLTAGDVAAQVQSKIADQGDAVAGQTSGKTFTLTTSTDTFTGASGNDTFNSAPVVVIDPTTGGQSYVDTLQVVDKLDGGAGTDTLNVTFAGAKTNAAPTLTNIENVNATFNDAGAKLDLAGATGVQKVTVTGSAQAAVVNSVGAIATLAVANQSKNVSFDGSTATTLGLSFDTVGKVDATTPAEVAVDIGAGAASKATTLNITTNNSNVEVKDTASITDVATTASIAATGVSEVKLTDGLALTSLTVTGAGSVDVSEVGLVKVATLTAGDGGVTFTTGDSTATTFSATTGAGKDSLTVDGAVVKTISTGAGDDKVTTATAALVATASIDLGAGNDTLTLHAAPAAAGATLTGGEGTDTLATIYAAYNTIAGYGATDLAKITGFETLSITTAALANTNNVDLSKLAGLTSAQILGVAAAGAATISGVGANSSVVIKGDIDTNFGSLTVTLKDATGSSDVLNLTLNDLYTENNDATATVEATNAFVVAASGVETLNVTSTGTASTSFLGATGNKADGVLNTLTLTDDALVTLNASGDQGFKFASANTQVKLATVDASANTAGANIDVSLAKTDGTAAAITVKGSATAANTLKGSGNADTIVGGAKTDVITGGAKGDTLTGNGGNDKFVFAAGDSAIGTGTFDTITDFAANTWGNGTAGAAGTEADLTDATKVTGDVLSFTVAGTAAAAKGIKVFVASSAADATTFLANTASADNTQSSAALDSTTNKLYVDVTGDGVTDFYISLTGVTTITAAAFELV